MEEFRTLVEALENSIRKSECGITFINGEKEEHYASYRSIYDRALCILYHFNSKGLGVGDELVFQLEDTQCFIEVFWACILGGIIPVPVSVGNNEEHRLKLFKIWNKLNRPHLVTTGEILNKLKTFTKESNVNSNIDEIEMKAIFFSEMVELSIQGQLRCPCHDDIAFIQFSSGSTGNPKGVTITHGNLVSNIKAMIERAKINRKDSMISWMPLTHDMGLIGFHITPLVLNINQYIIPTNLFIRHPKLWVDKLNEHKVTITASPNFGYQYFLRFTENNQNKDWNLSNVRLIVNGAEPISAKLCVRFLDELEKYGLRRSSIYPVYGIAEASLGVTFPPVGEEFSSVNVKRDLLKIGGKVIIVTDESSQTVNFVDLGYPIDFCSVRVCDNNNSVLSEDIVGLVQIKGGNVTQGYYNDMETTESTITFDGWLNTGDLGFIHNRRLIITGRAKDIIFINGQNYYSHDIERVAEESGSVKLGEVAAASTFNHKESKDQILLFVLYKKPVKEFIPIMKQLKKHILKITGLEIQHIIPIKKMPKTTSGKIQRFKLVEKFENNEFNAFLDELDRYQTDLQGKSLSYELENGIEEKLLKICREIIGTESIALEDNLIEYGGNSILLTLIHTKINEQYPGKTQIADLFTYPTVKRLSNFIRIGGTASINSSMRIKDVTTRYNELGHELNDIAIIGIAINLPNAENINEFWKGIRNGVSYTSDFPNARRIDIERYLGYKGKKLENIKYFKGAYLNDIDKFDHAYFKISSNEASLMNPEQRVFLETVFNAVEDAGYGGGRLAGSNTGVYTGQISDLEGYKYKEIIHDVSPDLLPISAAGNISALIPNRISYALDLKGPSMIVDTACSSSLVALHIACQSIRNGECDTAIVGSARISLLPLDEDNYRIGIESSDYLTRTFDQHADGSGIGEGIVAIMIKPVHRALDDRDNIYAVIKGSAVNQDGTSMGVTAPNAESQCEVLLKAWKNAGVNPETLSYIEAHGTGTKIGDVIEIDGLQRAFSKITNKKQFCAVGSVKSNMGHLYESAGLVGLLKAVLSLKNSEIPHSIGFNCPNDKIDFANTALYVNSKLKKWEKGSHPRRCGISSFGIGGTNCHLVLEEAPQRRIPEESVIEYKIITISAKSTISLSRMIEKFNEFICFEVLDKRVLDDICFTANTGRGHYTKRLAIIFKDYDDLKNKLKALTMTTLNQINISGVYYGEAKRTVNINQESESTLEKEKMHASKEANEQLIQFINSNYKDSEALDKICLNYIKDVHIEWEKLYIQGNYIRVSIPKYEFERNRHWINIPEAIIKTEPADFNNTFYTMKWKAKPAISQYPMECKNSGPILVMNDKTGLGDTLICKFIQNGEEVIEVNWEAGPRGNGDGKFIVYDKQYNYELLADTIINLGVSKIIHLFSYDLSRTVENENDLNVSQDRGAFCLFNLVKSLIKNNLNNTIDIVLVSDFVNKVTEQESKLKPEKATLFGLGKVVSLESSKLKCRCIDIDDETGIDNIISELGLRNSEPLIAYRKGIRYVEELTEIHAKDIKNDAIELKSNGVYVITGGLGGIGMEVARFIISKKNINLALVSRSRFPKQSEWKSILEEEKDTEICTKISYLQEIQSKGSEVLLLSLDISRLEEVEVAFNDLRKKYGKINGIIHGAGVAGSGLLINKDISSFKSVLLPKVWGTWALDKACTNDNLDFFIMFSSALTLAGEVGQSDYVAANSYQDAFSFYRNMQNCKALTINWVDWAETGMAYRHGFKSEGIFKSLTTQKGVEAFGKLMLSSLPRVIIGEMALDYKKVKLLEKTSILLSENIKEKVLQFKINNNALKKNEDITTCTELKLFGREDEDYTKTENEVAKLCQRVLGFEEISISDSFFEMGADSILLNRIFVLLDERFPGKLSITDLFAYTSIFKLSLYLDGSAEDSKTCDVKKNLESKLDISNIFDDIESGNLSVEEAVENLKRM